MLGVLIRDIKLRGMVVHGPGVSTPELSALPVHSLLVTAGSWHVLHAATPSCWPVAMWHFRICWFKLFPSRNRIIDRRRHKDQSGFQEHCLLVQTLKETQPLSYRGQQTQLKKPGVCSLFPAWLELNVRDIY